MNPVEHEGARRSSEQGEQDRESEEPAPHRRRGSTAQITAPATALAPGSVAVTAWLRTPPQRWGSFGNVVETGGLNLAVTTATKMFKHLLRADIILKIRFAANLPFVPYAWDEPWLYGFDRVVPALLRAFKPTVLVTQDGCDSHHLDPLAHLGATTRIWPHVGKVFHELAHELCDGRWLALGGGGYAIYEVVPRAWTLLFAEMVERPDLAAEVNDPTTVVPGKEAQDRVWSALRKDLDRLGEMHGLSFS